MYCFVLVRIWSENGWSESGQKIWSESGQKLLVRIPYVLFCDGQTHWQLRELAAPEAAPAAANLSRSPPTWVHEGQCEPMHDAQEVASPGFQKRRGPGPSQQVAGSGWSYADDPSWANCDSGGVGVRLRSCPLTGEICQTDPPGDGACRQLGAAQMRRRSTVSSRVAAAGRRRQHQPAPMRGRGPQP